MNSIEETADLIDLGVASIETKGGNSGTPEDLHSIKGMGIDEE